MGSGRFSITGSSSSGENTGGSPAFVSIMAIRPSSLAFAGSARGAVGALLALPGYGTRHANDRCARLEVRQPLEGSWHARRRRAGDLRRGCGRNAVVHHRGAARDRRLVGGALYAREEWQENNGKNFFDLGPR